MAGASAEPPDAGLRQNVGFSYARHKRSRRVSMLASGRRSRYFLEFLPFSHARRPDKRGRTATIALPHFHSQPRVVSEAAEPGAEAAEVEGATPPMAGDEPAASGSSSYLPPPEFSSVEDVVVVEHHYSPLPKARICAHGASQ